MKLRTALPPPHTPGKGPSRGSSSHPSSYEIFIVLFFSIRQTFHWSKKPQDTGTSSAGESAQCWKSELRTTARIEHMPPPGLDSEGVAGAN